MQQVAKKTSRGLLGYQYVAIVGRSGMPNPCLWERICPFPEINCMECPGGNLARFNSFGSSKMGFVQKARAAWGTGEERSMNHLKLKDWRNSDFTFMPVPS